MDQQSPVVDVPSSSVKTHDYRLLFLLAVVGLIFALVVLKSFAISSQKKEVYEAPHTDVVLQAVPLEEPSARGPMTDEEAIRRLQAVSEYFTGSSTSIIIDESGGQVTIIPQDEEPVGNVVDVPQE